MPAPRAERVYRVTGGVLVQPVAPIVDAAPAKLNHADRRNLVMKARRAQKHSSNRRGVPKPQPLVVNIPSGPSAKALDRILAEYA